jgi:hypothetical protein
MRAGSGSGVAPFPDQISLPPGVQPCKDPLSPESRVLLLFPRGPSRQAAQRPARVWQGFGGLWPGWSPRIASPASAVGVQLVNLP